MRPASFAKSARRCRKKSACGGRSRPALALLIESAARCAEGHVDESAHRRLARGGILVRDGAAVGFPGHLRIAIGTREQNDRLLAAWDRALAA